jgi:hypothetical protein
MTGETKDDVVANKALKQWGIDRSRDISGGDSAGDRGENRGEKTIEKSWPVKK